jgi:hypothetical protein
MADADFQPSKAPQGVPPLRGCVSLATRGTSSSIKSA